MFGTSDVERFALSIRPWSLQPPMRNEDARQEGPYNSYSKYFSGVENLQNTKRNPTLLMFKRFWGL